MKYSCTPNTKERKKCPFEVHYVIQSTKQNTNNQRSAQLIQKKRVQPLVSKKTAKFSTGYAITHTNMFNCRY